MNVGTDPVISLLDNYGVCTIALNRPQVLNAMNRELIDGVATAFNEANADPETRAILFTGRGRAFCAGDDRKESSRRFSESEARELVDAIQDASRAILYGDKPVVGAINGWAVGGGFEWAINCDFALWAQSATGFFPEVSLNLFVTGAVTTLLPEMVGITRAREMLMLGERYSAQQLFEMGAAWRVVPDDQLLDAAHKVARQLAESPSHPLREMKRILNKSAINNIESALSRETEVTVRCLTEHQKD
ncbi:MAG: enoyl-CoA hydratase/isomerase family protein [Pseudomonadota bacterium]